MNRHFKSSPQFDQPAVNVDRENSILRNVEIAKFGKNKNNSYFNQKFLNDLVEKGNAQKQGVKSRFGHPNMCASSLGTFVGRFKEFNQKEGKVYANLYLDSITKKTQVEGKGISMFDYIMDMAENNPDMFGNSIVVACHWFDEEIENEAGEKETVESLILQEFVSSDLVDDPAATDALFSSNPNDLGVIVTQFLDENPEIFGTIQKNPSIMEDFFSRYLNYTNRKSLINFNMSFLEKFKKKFGSKETEFDIDITLADGSIVTVVTDAEEPKVGDQVKDSDGKDVEDKEHLLPDGSAIVTVAGKITEIKPKADDEEETEEPTMQEVMNSVNSLSKKFDSFQTMYAKNQKENEEAFNHTATEFSKLSAKVVGMGKTIKSKYEAPEAETNGKKKDNANSTYDADAVREAREKLKNKKD